MVLECSLKGVRRAPAGCWARQLGWGIRGRPCFLDEVVHHGISLSAYPPTADSRADIVTVRNGSCGDGRGVAEKQNGYFQPAQAFAVYAGEERYPMAEGVDARGALEGRIHNAWRPLTGKRDMLRRTDCSLSRSALPMFMSQVACPLDLTRLPRHHDQRPFSHGRNQRAAGRRWHRPFWCGRATRGRRVAVHLLSATVSAHQPHRVFGRLPRTPPHGGHFSVTFPNPLSMWDHRPLRLDLSTRRPTAIVGNYVSYTRTTPRWVRCRPGQAQP